MTSKKNSYDVSKFAKDLKKLYSQTDAIAKQAVQSVSAGTASDEAFLMSFDEAEVVPFGSPGYGSISLSIDENDPVALDMEINRIATEALNKLENEIAEGLRGVLK